MSYSSRKVNCLNDTAMRLLGTDEAIVNWRVSQGFNVWC